MLQAVATLGIFVHRIIQIKEIEAQKKAGTLPPNIQAPKMTVTTVRKQES